MSVKMQTVLRLAGEMAREAKTLDRQTSRYRKLRDGALAAEWYAGYRLQKDLGWSSEQIVDLGFPLEPIPLSNTETEK